MDDKQTKATIGMVESAIENGEFIRAIKICDEILASDPENWHFLGLKGITYLKMDSFEEALSFFKHSVKIHPAASNVYFFMGKALSKMDRIPEAIQAYSKSIEIEPRSDSFICRGLLNKNINHLYEAIEDFKMSLGLDPNAVTPLYQIGLCYLKLDNYTEAELFLGKALEIDSSDSEALYNMAIVKSELGKIEDAVKLYSKAFILDIRNFDAIYNRGLLYKQIKKDDLFMEDMKIVIKNSEDRELIDLATKQLP